MPSSPLHDLHVALGARFVDFAGWDMPVQYEGVLAEHMAVRAGVGVFDVSHLGRFAFAGPGSTETLRRLFCNDVTSIGPGRAQYTMALTVDGGVIDDIIVWRLDEEEYLVLPNGANHQAVMGLTSAEPGTPEAVDAQVDTALLAVQGPESAHVLEAVLGVVPGRFRVGTSRFEDTTVTWAGTGYTGERGAEIVVDVAVAERFARAVLDAGARPCGLGARDTLRLEMGYPLWGQDLDEDTTPLEAGLAWVVDWDHDFVGRDALIRQREGGLRKRLIGFATAGRKIPRHGYALRTDSAEGVVASGNFSPVLGHGIGMGYLTPDPGGSVPNLQVEIRGDWVDVEVVDPPFIGRS